MQHKHRNAHASNTITNLNPNKHIKRQTHEQTDTHTHKTYTNVQLRQTRAPKTRTTQNRRRTNHARTSVRTGYANPLEQDMLRTRSHKTTKRGASPQEVTKAVPQLNANTTPACADVVATKTSKQETRVIAKVFPMCSIRLVAA